DARVDLAGLPREHEPAEAVDVLGAWIEVRDDLAHACEPRVGVVPLIVLAEVADGAEPDEVGEHVRVAEDERPEKMRVGQVDEVPDAVARRGLAVEPHGRRREREPEDTAAGERRDPPSNPPRLHRYLFRLPEAPACLQRARSAARDRWGQPTRRQT